jgi:hypothetical protein
MIAVTNVSRWYRRNADEIHALADVSVRIEAGAVTSAGAAGNALRMSEGLGGGEAVVVSDDVALRDGARVEVAE